MSESKKKDNRTDQDLQREILKGRRFGMAEAIGRAGGGAIKGASPIPEHRQALLDMGALLESHLPDPEGSLRAVIRQDLEQSPQMRDARPDSAAAYLARWLGSVLETPARLEELVRRADARWGRDYDEKPRFNHPGQPAPADDPYTPDSVRDALQDLLRRLD